MPTSESSSLSPGDRLGRYEILKPLGAGGMGEVYRARRDGKTLWVFRRGEVPARVFRLNLASGARQLWKTLPPGDTTAIYSITEFAIDPDGLSYFYSYRRLLSQLYLVRDLK